MNAKQLVDDALAQSIHLATDGKQIFIRSSRKPDDEFLQAIKSQRSAVVSELKHRQQLWLYSVAQGLKMGVNDVLKHEILIVDDVRNYWHVNIDRAVKTMRSSYRYMELMP